MTRSGTSATLTGLLRAVTHREPGESPQAQPSAAGPGPAAVLVGLVGGAGTTTLTRALGPPAQDAGRVLPAPDGRPLVLVTRSTAAGMAAALEAVSTSRQLGHDRPALVVVGDGPWPAPPQARARLRLLRDPQRLRIVVELPYVVGWRDVDDPLTDGQPFKAYGSAVARLAADLAAAGTSTSPAPAPAPAAVSPDAALPVSV